MCVCVYIYIYRERDIERAYLAEEPKRPVEAPLWADE